MITISDEDDDEDCVCVGGRGGDVEEEGLFSQENTQCSRAFVVADFCSML